jgi:light-regulated signal transduction histidine kinase (bacteriophytochrome)
MVIENTRYVIGVGIDVTERKKAEAGILKLNEDMAARNIELEFLNKELEAFIYSISHDLRAPIRSMANFAKFLVEDYSDKLDKQGHDYLTRINRGAETMTRLIEDLLRLSKISRQEIIPAMIDLSKMASSIAEGLRETNPERNVAFSIQQGLTADADPRLMEIALSNLLGNAWKFTSKKEKAHIDFISFQQDGKTVYCVRDDGAGFDQDHVEKIFWPFQRLHADIEFEGIGIGLSIVERIIHRHGGRIWAEGDVGKGATIYFTLK